jgi:hypothetical protein
VGYTAAMRVRFATLGLLGALSLDAEAQEIRMSNPDVEAPPHWTRLVKLPDGRTLISDGGIAIDAAIAKPASMPTMTVSESTGATFAKLFAATFEHDFSLSELAPGKRRNTFVGPGGLLLNGNYVTFLRQTGGSRVRLRANAGPQPMVIVIDGQPSGVMMPLAK